MNRLKFLTMGRLAATTVGLAGVLAASVTLADGGYHKSKLRFDGEPTFIDEGDALTAKFRLRGLNKKQDVKVTLTAKAKVKVVCVNPGGNVPPGAQPGPIKVEVSGSEVFSSNSKKVPSKYVKCEKY